MVIDRVAALHCFRLEIDTFSTGSTTVKYHMGYPSYGGKRVRCLGTVILGIMLCYFNYVATKGSNIFHKNSQLYHI